MGTDYTAGQSFGSSTNEYGLLRVQSLVAVDLLVYTGLKYEVGALLDSTK